MKPNTGFVLLALLIGFSLGIFWKTYFSGTSTSNPFIQNAENGLKEAVDAQEKMRLKLDSLQLRFERQQNQIHLYKQKLTSIDSTYSQKSRDHSLQIKMYKKALDSLIHSL